MAPEAQNHRQQRNIRTSRIWLMAVLLALLLAGMYWFVFGWAVPKTAVFAVPRKWGSIPLRENRNTVHNYFGEPVAGNGSAAEQWMGGSKGKMYRLTVYYYADTVAAAYSIHYRFENALLSKDYLIDSFSIR